MTNKILDKGDQSAVDEIIATGYPKNTEYLDELLSWTCDPNWPIAGPIYQYFIKLGKMKSKGYLLQQIKPTMTGDIPLLFK